MVVPNFFVTGILTTIVSLSILVLVSILVWPTPFVSRKKVGLILVVLSIALLLVGGGVGAPLLGIIIGATGTRINTPLPWWRKHLPSRSQRLFAQVWPWSFAVSLVFFLLLVVSSSLVGYFFNPNALNLTYTVILLVLAYLLLLSTIFAGFAYDIQQQPDPQPTSSTGGYPAKQEIHRC